MGSTNNKYFYYNCFKRNVFTNHRQSENPSLIYNEKIYWISKVQICLLKLVHKMSSYIASKLQQLNFIRYTCIKRFPVRQYFNICFHRLSTSQFMCSFLRNSHNNWWHHIASYVERMIFNLKIQRNRYWRWWKFNTNGNSDVQVIKWHFLNRLILQ